jgi:hypothetical protein
MGHGLNLGVQDGMIDEAIQASGAGGKNRILANGEFLGMHIGAYMVEGGGSLRSLDQCCLIGHIADGRFCYANLLQLNRLFFAAHQPANRLAPGDQGFDDSPTCFAGCARDEYHRTILRFFLVTD